MRELVCFWRWWSMSDVVKATRRVPTLQARLLRLRWGFRADNETRLRLVNIPVETIIWEQRFPFNMRGANAVVGVGKGGWDTLVHPFSATPIYRSLQARFAEGKAWQETVLFQHAVADFSAGRKSWNSCRNEHDLFDRCTALDRLYDDMSVHGYRPQYLSKWNRSVRGTAVPDETRIAITREGHAVRCVSGRHRVAMAKLIGIAEIPAIVQIRHASAPPAGEIIREIPIA